MSQLLIVDDDILFLQAICAETDFASIGFTQVHTASSAREARAILESRPIRVLLCDIEMPGESGLDLVRWVQERQLQVITLLLTCYSSFDYAQRAIRLGVFDYVLKPVRSELLCARCNVICGGGNRSVFPGETGRNRICAGFNRLGSVIEALPTVTFQGAAHQHRSLVQCVDACGKVCHRNLHLLQAVI